MPVHPAVQAHRKRKPDACDDDETPIHQQSEDESSDADDYLPDEVIEMERRHDQRA